LAEAVATFGLILTMFGALRWRAEMVPTIVGLYIAAAYWFTASTSFANPAVTIARALTDTFTGIAPSSVPAFIAAQTSGALVGLVLSVWLFGQPVTRGEQT
jgi:glycerol uptake facilitator-like aquaporin